MDTKLKKTHKKLKVIIILLSIIVPALVLVGFYPRMEKLANDILEEHNEPETVHYVHSSFVNDSVNFLSNLYGIYQYEIGVISTDEYVININKASYGYSNIKDANISYMYDIEGYQTEYYNKDMVPGKDDSLRLVAEHLLDDSSYILSAKEMEQLEIAGYYIVEYDENGTFANNFLCTGDTFEESFDVQSFSFVTGIPPVSAKAVFFLTYECDYVDSYINNYFYTEEEAYFEIGSPILIIAVAILVALIALLLPYIKPLNTGNEKLFRIPAEIIICLTGMAMLGIAGMFYAMSFTNLEFWKTQLADDSIYVLGYKVTAKLIYNLLRVANVVGWILCFFVEYIVITALRQFIAHPIKYIKERFIVIRLVRRIFNWTKKILRKIRVKTKDIISSLSTNKLLIMVLIVNLIVASIACVSWPIGIPLFMIYTVIAYLLVYKKYMKVCEQYEAVKETVHQMSEGNLKIEIEDDLGVFSPICDELVKIKDGFQKALVEEAKSRDMKTELITNVSHDLKTPLTAIITYVDLLKKDGITEEERKQYIETLDMKSQRLKVLIEDLFEVSKANSGNVSMNLMDVDVVGLLKQVRLELEDKINESNVDFRWNLPDEKVLLKLDGQKTYRIFSNLINNIVKYSLTGSRAFVEVIQVDKKVIITFKNISATEIKCDVENLTERFVRGDVSRNTEGSGLGLAIVKSFVELQGGSFNIEVDGDLFKAVIEWSK